MKRLLLWPLRHFLNRSNRKLTEKVCTAGVGSVVYDAKLIINHDNNKSSIIIGRNTHIRATLETFPGGLIEIGDYCYLGDHSRVWSDTNVRIGNRVLISHNVNIIDNKTHPVEPLARHNHFVHIIEHGFPKNINLDGKPIIIEDDVWIACNCIILRGVTIGKAAIVGAGSVVTKSIPPNAFVCGNPAKVIRYLAQE